MQLDPFQCIKTSLWSHLTFSDLINPLPIKLTFLRCDIPPFDVISQSEIAITSVGPILWFPWWQPSDAISKSHIAMYICPSFCLWSIPPMRYHYRKSFLSQSPFYRISQFYRISHGLSQNPRFFVKLHFTTNACFYRKSMFYCKSYIYRKTPLYRFIAIAPSHCHFSTYRLFPANAISLSHCSISQFYISQAHFAIAHRANIKPSPIPSPRWSPMRYRYRSSLSRIYIKSPIPWLPTDAILRFPLSRWICPCLIQWPTFNHFYFLQKWLLLPCKAWISRFKSFLPILEVKRLFLLFSVYAHARSKSIGTISHFQPFSTASKQKSSRQRACGLSTSYHCRVLHHYAVLLLFLIKFWCQR